MMGQKLARIPHQPSITGLRCRMLIALHLRNVLNVLSSTLPRVFLRAPCIHTPSRPLATKPGEKYGLVLETVWLMLMIFPLAALATENAPKIWIMPFNGDVSSRLQHGIPELMEVCFSQNTPNIVIDRTHVNKVTKELNLNLKGVTSQREGLQLGQHLGATVMIAGGIVEQPGMLVVNAHAYEVTTAQLLTSHEVSGDPRSLAKIVFDICHALAQDLQASLPELKTGQTEKAAVPNLHFMNGLSFYYSADYSRALGQFVQASKDKKIAPVARWWMAKTFLAQEQYGHAYAELAGLDQTTVQGVSQDEIQLSLKKVRERLSAEEIDLYGQLFAQ